MQPWWATPDAAFRTDNVATTVQRTPLLDLTDFKRDLSELTDRLGNAQDCL